MDRRTRRDVVVTSALGVTLVVATLTLGDAFIHTGDADVDASAQRGAGALQLPDAPAARSIGRGPGGTISLSVPATPGRAGDDVVAAVPVGAPSAGTTAASDGASSAAAGRSGSGGSSPSGRRGTAGSSSAAGSGPATGSGPGSGSTGAAPTPAPSVPAPTGVGGGDDAADTPAPTVTASTRVRLRVTDVSVTGTAAGTLQPGAQVRLRLAASQDATADGSASTVPEKLDLRLGLDEKAIAALKANAGNGTNPLALRARVDLVDASTGSFSVRVRMQLTPVDTQRTTISASESTPGEGASNVVEVLAPIGEKAPAAGDPTPDPTDPKPTDPTPTDPTPATPAPDPVEVLLPLRPAPGTPSGDDGASISLPLPATPAPTGTPDASAGVDVVVHVPEPDEPLGGSPEVVTPIPDPTPVDPTPVDPTPVDPTPASPEPTPDPVPAATTPAVPTDDPPTVAPQSGTTTGRSPFGDDAADDAPKSSAGDDAPKAPTDDDAPKTPAADDAPKTPATDDDATPASDDAAPVAG